MRHSAFGEAQPIIGVGVDHTQLARGETEMQKLSLSLTGVTLISRDIVVLESGSVWRRRERCLMSEVEVDRPTANLVTVLSWQGWSFFIIYGSCAAL